MKNYREQVFEMRCGKCKYSCIEACMYSAPKRITDHAFSGDRVIVDMDLHNGYSTYSSAHRIDDEIGLCDNYEPKEYLEINQQNDWGMLFFAILFILIFLSKLFIWLYNLIF